MSKYNADVCYQEHTEPENTGSFCEYVQLLSKGVDTAFPWRTYSRNSLLISFEKLRKKLNSDELSFLKIDSNLIPLIKISRVAYDCTDCFFQYERLSTSSVTNMSCVEYWNKRKEKILDYYNKQSQKKDLFGTIVFMKRAPSHFSPYVAGMVYKYFNASTVLDPFAGWGNRCLAAMALDINYIGVDSNPKIKGCYDQIIKTFQHSKKIKFISGKYEDTEISRKGFLKYGNTKLVPDLIFTSPPFWNTKGRIVEKYTGTDPEWSDFWKNSLSVLFDKYLDKVPIVLYVDSHMYSLISEKVGESKQQLLFGSSTNKKTKNYTHHTLYCW